MTNIVNIRVRKLRRLKMSDSNNQILSTKEKRKFVWLIILFCSVLIINEAVAQNVSLSELTKNKYAV